MNREVGTLCEIWRCAPTAPPPGYCGARRNQLARALDRVAQEMRLDEP
jgi:hypothetical protein